MNQRMISMRGGFGIHVRIRPGRAGDGSTLVASGNVAVTWSDYGITRPSPGFVTVTDHGAVDFLVSPVRV